MRTLAKYGFGAVFLCLAAAQARRPLRANAPGLSERVPSSAPPAVGRLLDRACADCHSDRTRWPWYSEVAPASWLVADHVHQGRRRLNFSQWERRERRSDADRRDILHAIAREVETRRMPLVSYQLVHSDSRLSSADRRAIAEWARRESGRLAELAPAKAVVAAR